MRSPLNFHSVKNLKFSLKDTGNAYPLCFNFTTFLAGLKALQNKDFLFSVSFEGSNNAVRSCLTL
ncbi:hypothetical protein B6N60_05214 [Richelia sinica FACHB-800]|uniref:Uncharacterized protein n=1 Tax=Richelia sinica FACHB-800 TaxID=1357546 RepID=A0A975TCV9_9NOST|nr:hypothetical protein B6N60_05214 [Richelia sinica FACHB-800]